MKSVKMYKSGIVLNVLQEKCPNCKQTKVFEASKGIFSMPRMKEECDQCHYHFDREPGYFLGAMYVSYALAVFESIVTFLICYLFLPQLGIEWTPFVIIGVIILFAKKNYKLSRVIYMHLFPW